MFKKQENILETGGFTVVLGKKYYQDYFPSRKNELLKITYLKSNHNEFTCLEEIQKIKNYKEYYGVPTTSPIELAQNHKILIFLKDKINQDLLEALKKSSVYFYVNNAGNEELFKTIEHMQRYRSLIFWRSYTDILNFINQIMTGLNFLHQRKICHLDVKPENIMVNTKSRKFRLIDFGFASQEPFQEYLKEIRGTPRYFPKYTPEEIVNVYFPMIIANDMIKKEGKLPMERNPKLVYKIDSFSLGRIIYCLEILFTEIKPVDCTCRNKSRIVRNKIMDIRDKLLINDVEKRSYIEELYQIYFTDYKQKKKFITLITL